MVELQLIHVQYKLGTVPDLSVQLEPGPKAIYRFSQQSFWAVSSKLESWGTSLQSLLSLEKKAGLFCPCYSILILVTVQQ